MHNADVAVNERRALVMALAAVALWSTVATGFKLGLRHLEPLQLLWLGSLVSLVFFAVLRIFVAVPSVARHEYLAAAALGVINPFCYYVILFEAYDRLPAQIAQPLNYTWAVALAILAVPILKQRLSKRMFAGIAVSYLGVVVLVTQGKLTDYGIFDPVGVALALASTLLWATYWLATVRLTLHPVALMLTGFAIGTPLVAAACHWTVGLPALNVTNVSFGLWVGLVEMGVAFLLWQRALTSTNQAARIGQLIFLSPFISLVLISTVLGERIHVSAVAGLTLIVSG